MANTKKNTLAAEAISEAAVKAVVAEKKEEAVKTTTAKAAEPKTEKAVAKKKTTAPKKAKETVYIQQSGNEITSEELIANAKKLSGIKSPKTVDVYVRPEINKVYYVIDGDNFGEFDLV